MLIKPFTAIVKADGQAELQIMHNIHGLVWKVYQIGFALAQLSAGAQVAGHVNGIPLSGAVVMQQSLFDFAPYAMESYFVGPPYIVLSAGDYIACAVRGAVVGDVFTAGAYVEERQATANLGMG